MNWLSKIFGGGVTAVTKGVERTVEVFRPNAEKSAARDHEYNTAALGQFSAEFVARAHRSWWDSFVDGLNRLPRPVITLGVLGLFVLAPINPDKFIQVASAYTLIPDGMWALLGLIVAFYFGGRMQATGADFRIKKEMVETAKSVQALRISPDEDAPGRNKVVDEWLAKK